MTLRLGLAALLSATLAAPAGAACLTAGTGAKCATVGLGTGAARLPGFRTAPATPLPFVVGDILPDDRPVLLNTAWCGLPPVGDGWIYKRSGWQVFRVERQTNVILEDVTGNLARNC
jgi:hypothetical protein